MKKEINKHPTLSYNRYKYEDLRGYDIISLDNRNERNLENVQIKDKETSWQKIVKNVGGNIYF